MGQGGDVFAAGCGENTYQANRSLGLPDDCQDFTDAAVLLKHFVGKKPFRLLTNNPKKLKIWLNSLHQVTREKHVTGVGEWNKRYLNAKRDWGHRLAEEDLN